MRFCRRESREGVFLEFHRPAPKTRRDERYRAEDQFQARPRHDQRSDQPGGPRCGRRLSFTSCCATPISAKSSPRSKAQSLQKIAIAGAVRRRRLRHPDLLRFFALHTIGRDKVPYAVAALASFTSSTIGHSLGAAVLTGGLVRFRIYSVWGLTVARYRQDRLRHRHDVLARQCVPARRRDAPMRRKPPAPSTICRPGSIARSVLGAIVRHRLLSALARAAPAHHRPLRLADRRCPACASRCVQIGIRRAGSDARDARDVRPAAAGPAGRFHDRAGRLSSQPRSWGRSAMRPAALASSRPRCWSDCRNFQREELLAALLTFRALYFVLPLLLGHAFTWSAGALHAGATRAASARRIDGA